MTSEDDSRTPRRRSPADAPGAAFVASAVRLFRASSIDDLAERVRDGAQSILGDCVAQVRLTGAEVAISQWLSTLVAASPNPTRSWLSAPLLDLGGSTIGMVHAARGANGHFSVREEAGLIQFTELASVALENLQRFEAAQRATSERDDFLGVVSHDLRNPLNTIAMGVAMLEGDPDLAPAHRAIVQRVQRAGNRLGRILADLLDVTRIDAGKLSVDLKVIAPQRLLEEIADLAATQAGQAGVTLHVPVPSVLPPILADHDRVMQVLLNLVGNAVKFTPRGGTVVVSATRHGDEVRFEVRDTGAGIAAGDLPHVFDRFWQARSTAKMGTGLGLYIAKGIVEAHGGRLKIESTEGLGTSIAFSMMLPPEDRPSPVPASS